MKLVVVIIALVCAMPAWAVTVTVGDNTGNTHSGTEDNKLRQFNATSNFGGDTTWEVTKFGAGDHTHGAIRFPGLSSISGPVTVTAATLFIRLSNVGGTVTYTVDARRFLRNWIEAQSTWNVYSTGNSWTTVGGLGDGNDRSATISGSVSVDTTLGYFGITGAQLITDVQNMINGSVPNYGWHLERNGVGNDGNYRVFQSSEGTDGQRPYLEITYTVDGGGGGAATFFSRRISQ
jgi:hypothetical protein